MSRQNKLRNKRKLSKNRGPQMPWGKPGTANQRPIRKKPCPEELEHSMLSPKQLAALALAKKVAETVKKKSRGTPAASLVGDAATLLAKVDRETSGT